MCLLTVSVTVRVALIVDFLGGSEVQNLTANTGDVGSIPGSRRSPGEGNGNPLQYYCLKKSHRQRSLVGYSPWDCKESDTTKRLHSFTHSLTLYPEDFPIGSDGKASVYNVGDLGSIPGSGRSPGEGNGKPLTWRIPWTGEPSGLQSMGSQRVGHD